jgi:hypothetical protein
MPTLGRRNWCGGRSFAESQCVNDDPISGSTWSQTDAGHRARGRARCRLVNEDAGQQRGDPDLARRWKRSDHQQVRHDSVADRHRRSLGGRAGSSGGVDDGPVGRSSTISLTCAVLHALSSTTRACRSASSRFSTSSFARGGHAGRAPDQSWLFMICSCARVLLAAAGLGLSVRLLAAATGRP